LHQVGDLFELKEYSSAKRLTIIAGRRKVAGVQFVIVQKKVICEIY
jgi:hypothetical protein